MKKIAGLALNFVVISIFTAIFASDISIFWLYVMMDYRFLNNHINIFFISFSFVDRIFFALRY